MTDQDHLIIKLKSGDESAYRWLIETYHTRVISLCNQYLHDPAEAEDLAQDVFVEVIESIHRFRGDAAIATWIYRIAVNKSLNRKKRLARKKRLFPGNDSSGVHETEQTVTSTGSDAQQRPDHQMEQEEDRKALKQAIDKLPENQRTAFLLSKYEELPYKEIAEVMNTSLSAVESLLFRARLNLQKHLKHYLEKNMQT